MFRIGRKFVHVGVEKIITLYQVQVYVELENFRFTFNDAEDYATSETWQKIFILSLISEENVCVMWHSGRVLS